MSWSAYLSGRESSGQWCILEFRQVSLSKFRGCTRSSNSEALTVVASCVVGVVITVAKRLLVVTRDVRTLGRSVVVGRAVNNVVV